jgi:hypothetical protein
MGMKLLLSNFAVVWVLVAAQDGTLRIRWLVWTDVCPAVLNFYFRRGSMLFASSTRSSTLQFLRRELRKPLFRPVSEQNTSL